MRLFLTASLTVNSDAVSYLQPVVCGLLLILSTFAFSPSAQAGFDDMLHYAPRTLVANPNNFKRIHINGRGVSAAIAPCPIAMGLINCTLEKLDLITLPVRSVHEDYNLAQVFYYPNTEQPKTAVVIAQKTGLMDDSVSGQRYRVSFKLEDGGTANATWILVQYGEQFQCARGDMAGRWVKRGCV
ncbi:hypothetical protein ACS8E3_09105 [Psychrobacter sp. 2Y5]|uniref:hypothetical protein n=1 Tax=unclassified Psychrobacter TaxID=196806 RepID=UPI003F473954